MLKRLDHGDDLLRNNSPNRRRDFALKFSERLIHLTQLPRKVMIHAVGMSSRTCARRGNDHRQIRSGVGEWLPAMTA